MLNSAADLIGRWICLFSQPRNERLALSSLQNAGFDAYLPQYKTFIQHARRRRADVRPLFSRYLFVRIETEGPLIWSAYRLKGVSGYAGKSIENSLVRDEVIDTIRARESEEGLVVMDFLDPQPGRKVMLQKGPLAGFEAIFSERDDQRRSWIFVEFMGKMHRLKYDNHSIRRVS